MISFFFPPSNRLAHASAYSLYTSTPEKHPSSVHPLLPHSISQQALPPCPSAAQTKIRPLRPPPGVAIATPPNAPSNPIKRDAKRKKAQDDDSHQQLLPYSIDLRARSHVHRRVWRCRDRLVRHAHLREFSSSLGLMVWGFAAPA
ncbi:hypothetical protein Hypma_004082 [Hypsizygus marmoreus]|uniref:Uncharacterized protein n=1 Tax=Hypsizygus marmoreus TaxID=39966 RepID=A0A369K3V6_HYPMA|nr:hypothetical protein Hypma_004082 [Hypsizygus marmoreus]